MGAYVSVCPCCYRQKRVEVFLNFNPCSCGGSTRTNDLQVMSLASYQLLHSAMSSFISAHCSYFLFVSAKLACFVITAKLFCKYIFFVEAGRAKYQVYMLVVYGI